MQTVEKKKDFFPPMHFLGLFYSLFYPYIVFISVVLKLSSVCIIIAL